MVSPGESGSANKGLTATRYLASGLLPGGRRAEVHIRKALGLPVVYETSLDRASLRIVEESGATGTTYCASLVGPVDDLWIEAFRRFRVDSKGCIRFGLDPGQRLVLFRHRCADPLSDLSPILATLETVVDLTNRLASSNLYAATRSGASTPDPPAASGGYGLD